MSKLESISTDELLAELRRRKHEEFIQRAKSAVTPEGHKASDFYFVPFDEEFSDGEHRPFMFGIVLKDFWDKYHHLDDTYEDLSDILPPSFSEAMESVYEYAGSSAEQAENELLAVGFSKPQDARWHNEM